MSSIFTVTLNLLFKKDFWIPKSVLKFPGLLPVVNFISPLPPIDNSTLATLGRLSVNMLL